MDDARFLSADRQNTASPGNGLVKHVAIRVFDDLLKPSRPIRFEEHELGRPGYRTAAQGAKLCLHHE
jgi:hypothetical protein